MARTPDLSAEPLREHKRAVLDAGAVRDAYRRWAGVYDAVFGGVSSFGRKRAVEAVNRLPGARVLEVGVGTGLALPRYRRDKRVVGVDLSREMLEKARERVAAEGLTQVDGPGRDGRGAHGLRATIPSTSRWPCSPPPWCRTRGGSSRRCRGWCGRAGTCCS